MTYLFLYLYLLGCLVTAFVMGRIGSEEFLAIPIIFLWPAAVISLPFQFAYRLGTRFHKSRKLEETKP